MVVSTEILKNAATDILRAVDSSELSSISTLLEIDTDDNTLSLSVANKEYFVSIRMDAIGVETFHATVNASLLLKLISQTTAENIEFRQEDAYLQVNGNGAYKIPLVFDGNEVLSIHKIDILNPTVTMTVDRDILMSILKYNSKELNKGFIAKPVQRYYYVDEQGCITFTTGACVNKFFLTQPVRVLLNNRVVNLFRLFKDDLVDFTLGYDALSSDIIQTKVRFETPSVTLTAILPCDDSMINSVPVTNIRNLAEAVHPYSISVSKDLVLQAIGRLQLFNKNIKGSSDTLLCTFEEDAVTLSNARGDVSERVEYVSPCAALSGANYVAALDLNDLKATFSNCEEAHLTLKFGMGRAIVVARTNIINVIPQCIVS